MKTLGLISAGLFLLATGCEKKASVADMTPPFPFLPVAILLVDKNGQPLSPLDSPSDVLGIDFFTPGLILTAATVLYAVAVIAVRRNKIRRPFSYTYWLVLGSGIAMMMVPFVSLAIQSAIDYFRH